MGLRLVSQIQAVHGGGAAVYKKREGAATSVLCWERRSKILVKYKLTNKVVNDKMNMTSKIVILTRK